MENIIKRAFYREAKNLLSTYPSDNQIEVMWNKWWEEHQDTPQNLMLKYWNNDDDSIYDWNVNIVDWWENNLISSI